MKISHFILLSSLVVCFSDEVVEGRLVFSYDTSLASEGSNATFTCQDTGGETPINIMWSFQRASDNCVLSENGFLAPGLNRNKYELSKSASQLQVSHLRVNDTGNYTCCIKGNNGETLLSATATLTVTVASKNDRAPNTSHPASASLVPVSLLHRVVSALSNNLQPSPTAASVPPTTMQRTVFHPVSSPSSKTRVETTVQRQACGNFSNDTVAFNEDETSPSLITVKEGEQLKLHCDYCVKSSKQAVNLVWYKEDQMIHNDTHFVITNHGKELGVPMVQQNKDEGLYKCEVNYIKQKISKFMTAIVKKVEPNPLLSSVLAQNKSFLSVQITWHLTDHAVFTAAQVSLKLRLLNCSEWSYKVTNVSGEQSLHLFEHLQPSSVYILNITLYNKNQQTENRAVVFWSAASNSSEFDQKLLLLYRMTNKRALGVALGIIGLLLMTMITYACVTWLHSDKKGYSIPPGQMKRNENDENGALYLTDTHLFYNRAFEDDKVHWMDDDL